jgi:hypothetical protein
MLDEPPDTLTGSDLDFLRELESCRLAPAAFGHRGHVRLAWICCQIESLEAASARCAGLIRAFANSLGATTKFHQTLTTACVALVADSMRPGEYWEEYVRRAPEILTDPRKALAWHYSTERLQSDLARERFVAPDRAPLPGVLGSPTL